MRVRWISGSVVTDEEEDGEEEIEDNSDKDHELLQAFLQRRQLLVKHLHLFRQKGPIRK